MNLRPGSFPWFVAHDSRNSWRRFTAMFGCTSRRAAIATAIAAVLAIHVAAWLIVHFMRPVLHDAGGAQFNATLVALILCTLSWMVAQSLFGTTRALFDRGDLDLLLSSPLPGAKIFAGKALAIAAGTFGSIAILVLPIVHVAAAMDSPAWLGAYPALLGLTMIATAMALSVAIGLFFLVGPVRARLLSQLAGAAIGGAFVLAAQVAAMLPITMRTALGAWFEQETKAETGPFGWLLGVPVNAFRGEPSAMIMMLCAGIVLLAAIVRLLGERFVAASLAAVGAEAGRRQSSSAMALRRFRAGLGPSLRRKESLLLARDPSLFAQLSLQIIYTVPVAVVLLRSDTLPAALALAPTIVVIAAQIAASLAWITVSGEDAPELIATAPVTAANVDRIKLGAVVTPVLAILSVPLIGLAYLSWMAALTTAAFAGGAAASTALLNFWHPMPGNRRGMLRRHTQSKLIALVEHFLAVLWAIAIVFALFGSWITIVPALFALSVLMIVKHRGTVKSKPSKFLVQAGTGPIQIGIAKA